MTKPMSRTRYAKNQTVTMDAGTSMIQKRQRMTVHSTGA